MIGIESLTLEGGGTVDDVDLDFTLPGYPSIELKVRVHCYLIMNSAGHVTSSPAAWRQGHSRHYP